MKAKTRKELQPAYGLMKRYRPDRAEYGFRARTPAEARRWQTETRRALRALLAVDQLGRAPLRPRLIETRDRGDYVRQKLMLQTAPHTLMPVYLLLPKRAPRPTPVVLAFHGHGNGAKEIVGLWEDGSERKTPDGYQKDFAVALCRAGFAVAAPEIACFGERVTDFSYLDPLLGSPVPSTCHHAAMLAMHLGLTVPGMRVHDALRLVDYLETRRDLDTTRLGAMGISGGGMHTFFSTCLDRRIKACVISGYYSTFRDSILGMGHCSCNYVPALSAFGEMQDLVGLIAPRPLLIEAGSRDPIFPIRAVKRAVAAARRVYGVFGASGHVAADFFEGRHQISGAHAYDFLRHELGAGE